MFGLRFSGTFPMQQSVPGYPLEVLSRKAQVEFAVGVYVDEAHVHRVYRREDIGGALDDALARFRHRDRRARRQEDRLVATAERQEG